MQGSEYLDFLRHSLPKELMSIPKPHFVSTIFPEEPIAICRPLFSPFDNFAITHFGTVFKFRPLITVPVDDFITLSPMAYCIPKYKRKNDRQYVVLQNPKFGFRKSYFVDRLLLDRFYGVKVTDRVDVEFLDGDMSNPHVMNLEAIYKAPIMRKVPDEERDLHEFCPIH